MDLKSQMEEAIRTTKKTKALIEKVIISRTLKLESGLNDSIEVKQGDHNSRVLQLTLYKTNREVLDLTDSTVYLFVKKDKETIPLVGRVSLGTSGIVEFTLTKEALSMAGMIKCEVVRVGSDESTLSFPIFDIKVKESIYKGIILSTDEEFTTLEGIVPIKHME